MVTGWVDSLKFSNFSMEILEEKDRTPLLLIVFEPNLKEKPKNIIVYGHLDK